MSENYINKIIDEKIYPIIRCKDSEQVIEISKALVDGGAKVLEINVENPSIYKAINEVSKQNGVIIATGGGAILKKENVDNLKQNGTLYFLDRDLSLLLPTEDRPLSRDKEAIEKRYKERYPIYCQIADVRINGNLTVNEVAELILEEIKKWSS